MVFREPSGQGAGISWYSRRVLALCVGGALCIATIPRSAIAESVSYFGRDFRVDKLVRVNGDQLSIEVDKHSFLAQSDNAGRQVFQIYATKPELFSPDVLNKGYGKFISSLVLQGETEAASTAIQGMLASMHVSDEQRTLVFGGVVASPQGEALLRTEILDAQGDARRGSCLALRSLHSEEQAAIRKLLASDANWMAQQCPRILVSLAQASFEAGDTSSGASVIGFVGDFFAEDGGEIAQAAHTSYERLRSVQAIIDSGDADQFESGLRVASFDALLRNYYQRFKPTLVIEFGERAFTQQRPAAVLRGLSLLDFSQRNTKHHEFLLRAVQELQCKDSTALQMDVVQKMLLAYASKDEAVKQQYVSFLSSCIDHSGDSDDLKSGIALMTLLTDVRPDPSPENDILRSTLAESCLDMGDMGSADIILRSVRTQLPWINRFRLLLKSDAYILGMVLLGVLVVVRWLFKLGSVFSGSSMARSSSASDKTASKVGNVSGNAESEEGQRSSHFFHSSLKKQIYKELDEYGDCLSKLNLESGASLPEIKNAYRHIVKTLHPDMNPKASREDTNKFIELTKTYERLLVLHEEREKRSSDS